MTWTRFPARTGLADTPRDTASACELQEAEVVGRWLVVHTEEATDQQCHVRVSTAPMTLVGRDQSRSLRSTWWAAWVSLSRNLLKSNHTRQFCSVKLCLPDIASGKHPSLRSQDIDSSCPRASVFECQLCFVPLEQIGRSDVEFLVAILRLCVEVHP